MNHRMTYEEAIRQGQRLTKIVAEKQVLPPPASIVSTHRSSAANIQASLRMHNYAACFSKHERQIGAALNGIGAQINVHNLAGIDTYAKRLSDGIGAQLPNHSLVSDIGRYKPPAFANNLGSAFINDAAFNEQIRYYAQENAFRGYANLTNVAKISPALQSSISYIQMLNPMLDALYRDNIMQVAMQAQLHALGPAYYHLETRYSQVSRMLLSLHDFPEEIDPADPEVQENINAHINTASAICDLYEEAQTKLDENPKSQDPFHPLFAEKKKTLKKIKKCCLKFLPLVTSIINMLSGGISIVTINLPAKVNNTYINIESHAPLNEERAKSFLSQLERRMPHEVYLQIKKVFEENPNMFQDAINDAKGLDED